MKNINSFIELEKYLLSLPEGGIQGSAGFFKSEKLIEVINLVREKKMGIKAITRQGGLREKVSELINKEKTN